MNEKNDPIIAKGDMTYDKLFFISTIQEYVIELGLEFNHSK